jgi:TctA family transporter
LLAGAAAIGDSATLRHGPAEFPAIVGGLLVVVAIALLARGAKFGAVQHRPWTVVSLTILTTAVLLVVAALQRWGPDVALHFGPAEFVAVNALQLAISMALTRISRLRAAGMLLLGLLLSAVGIDISTGVLRLTFGFESLVEGIPMVIVMLGLLIAADAILCAAAPAAFLAGYARQVAGWRASEPRRAVALAMRLAAIVALATAGYGAMSFEGSPEALVPLAAFAAFGVACRLFAWNRLVFLVAFGLGTALEENIRRALLLSRGDIRVFVERPTAAVLMLMSCALLLWASGIFTPRRFKS